MPIQTMCQRQMVSIPAHEWQTYIIANRHQPGRVRKSELYKMYDMLPSGWDDDLYGGKLCLYHNPGGKGSGNCGEQVTLVAPVGDTLVVFDSRIEHEVMPSFADR